MHGSWRDRRCSIGGFRSRFRPGMWTPVGVARVDALTCFRAQQLVFLLELFEPDGTVDFGVTLLTSHRGGEESGLVADDVVAQRQSLSLVVSRPIRERPLNVRKLALGPLDGRPAAVVRVQILVFLPQYFGDGAKPRISGNGRPLPLVPFTFSRPRTLL